LLVITIMIVAIVIGLVELRLGDGHGRECGRGRGRGRGHGFGAGVFRSPSRTRSGGIAGVVLGHVLCRAAMTGGTETGSGRSRLVSGVPVASERISIRVLFACLMHATFVELIINATAGRKLLRRRHFVQFRVSAQSNTCSPSFSSPI
jgi:hypothetical protein